MLPSVTLGTAVEGKHFTKDGKLASIANRKVVPPQQTQSYRDRADSAQQSLIGNKRARVEALTKIIDASSEEDEGPSKKRQRRQLDETPEKRRGDAEPI
jgi:hypothetical protein